jgi:4-amino-4-deoxy-L-arabinose transferase-like glycosyltransferase
MSAETSDRLGWRRWVPPRGLSFCSLALVVSALLFARDMDRLLDVDEHQFVASAVLVDDGCFPYHDFPYFHMPTLVYAYALFLGGFSHKLLVIRLFSTLCGAATVLLLFSLAWSALRGISAGQRWCLAGGVTLIFFCSRLFTYTTGLGWNHDTAVLCTLGAFVFQIRGLRRGNLWAFAAAGVLVGLAMGIRLSFGLIFIPFGLSLFVGKSPMHRRQRLAGLVVAAACAALALLPAWVHMVLDSERFLFGNLRYQPLFASAYPAEATFSAKLKHTLSTFVADPGNAALSGLFLLTMGYQFWRLRAWQSPVGNELRLLAGLLPCLGLGALAPTPTQGQYFYLLLPFMTLAIIYVISCQCSDLPAMKRWSRALAGIAVAVGLVNLPRWYCRAVIELPTPHSWTTMKVHEIGQWIKHNCPADARVLTIEPIFPLEGGMKFDVDYAVGPFAIMLGPRLSAEQRSRLQISWGPELERKLAIRPPDAIFGAHGTGIVPMFVRLAGEKRYRRVATPDQKFELWVALHKRI